MYNLYNSEANSNSTPSFTLEEIVQSYKSYLIRKRISGGSIRSYLSDVRNFLTWVTSINETKHVLLDRFQVSLCSPGMTNGSNNSPVIPANCPELAKEKAGIYTNNPEIVKSFLRLVNERLLTAYKDSQVSNNTPVKTINRRFSSLRGFGNFCQLQTWSNTNPFDTLKNISEEPEALPETSHHLEEFRSYLWKNKASKLTIKNYLADTKQFIAWSKTSSNYKL